MYITGHSVFFFFFLINTGHSFVLNVMLRPSQPLFISQTFKVAYRDSATSVNSKWSDITSNVKQNHYVAVYHWIPFPYRYMKLHWGSIFEFRAFAGSDTQHTHNLSLSQNQRVYFALFVTSLSLSLSLFLSIFFFFIVLNHNSRSFSSYIGLLCSLSIMRDGVSPIDHQGFFMHTIF